MKTCLICGAEFETRRKDRRFCSRKCKSVFDNQLRDQRNCEAKLAAKPLIKKCPFCGVEFEPVRSTQVYCSKRCYSAARRIRERERHAAKRPPRPKKTCAFCGKEFEARAKNCRFCSKRCQIDAQTEMARQRRETTKPPPPTLICPRCGKEFVRRTKLQRYCSCHCAHLEANRRYRRQARIHTTAKEIFERLQIRRAGTQWGERVYVPPPEPKPKPKPERCPLIPAAQAENRKPTVDELLDWIFDEDRQYYERLPASS